MVGYKLSKNDWVTPFFVIFRSVREKLLVTVSFDHPVLIYTYFVFMRRKTKTTFQHVEMPLSLSIHSRKIHCTVRQTVHYL